jgi:hypothetical protein
LTALFGPPSKGLVVFAIMCPSSASSSQVNRWLSRMSPASSLCARRVRRCVYHQCCPGFTCAGRGVPALAWVRCLRNASHLASQEVNAAIHFAASSRPVTFDSALNRSRSSLFAGNAGRLVRYRCVACRMWK